MNFKYAWKCPHCDRMHEDIYDPSLIGRQSVDCPVTQRPVRIISAYFRHKSQNCNEVFCLRIPVAKEFRYNLSMLVCPCCGLKAGHALEQVNPSDTLVPGMDAVQTIASESRVLNTVEVLDLAKGRIGTVENGRRATLGRGVAADIRVETDDPRISRVHLAIDLTGRTPLLEVLGVNGVTIEGRRIKAPVQIPLPLETRISLYNTNIILHSK